MNIHRTNRVVAASCTALTVARQVMMALAFAAILVVLGGCGALLTPSSLVSLGTSLIGGVANGSIMGGSVLGALREDKSGDAAQRAANAPDTATQPAANRDAQQPVVGSADDVACTIPEAASRSLPCT